MSADQSFNIGDGPIQSEVRDQMRVLAGFLDELLNGEEGSPEREAGKRWAFMLLVVPFGEAGGRCNYVANLRRDDAMRLLMDQLKHFIETDQKNTTSTTGDQP